jgi:photosystem II stability/assembly factor-like uncharacterized protein
LLFSIVYFVCLQSLESVDTVVNNLLEAEPICLSVNGRTITVGGAPATRLLVATVEAVCEFHRESFSAPWVQVRDDILAGNHVSALVFEPKSTLLFAGLHFQGGILASPDYGRTWKPLNNGLQSGHVYTITVVQQGEHTTLYAGTEPAMVYRSENLGESWVPMPSMRDVPDTDQWLFPRSIPHVKNIAVHPAQPKTLYVCVEQGDLLKSTDGGTSWRQLTSMERADDKFRRDMHRVTFRQDNPAEIFLTTGIGLYHTMDGGEHWERLTDPSFRLGYPDPFFIHPEKPASMFMVGAGVSPNPDWGKTGTAHPLFMRSTDAGHSWTESMEGMRIPVKGNMEAAAMHFNRGALEFFVGTACGELYTSRDGGDSWALLAENLPAISKGPHFRHFLPPERRTEYENKLRALNAFS